MGCSEFWADRMQFGPCKWGHKPRRASGCPQARGVGYGTVAGPGHSWEVAACSQTGLVSRHIYTWGMIQQSPESCQPWSPGAEPWLVLSSLCIWLGLVTQRAKQRQGLMHPRECQGCTPQGAGMCGRLGGLQNRLKLSGTCYHKGHVTEHVFLSSLSRGSVC